MRALVWHLRECPEILIEDRDRRSQLLFAGTHRDQFVKYLLFNTSFPRGTTDPIRRMNATQECITDCLNKGYIEYVDDGKDYLAVEGREIGKIRLTTKGRELLRPFYFIEFFLQEFGETKTLVLGGGIGVIATSVIYFWNTIISFIDKVIK